MPEPRLMPAARRALLEVARGSIAHGLRHGREPAVDPDEHAPELREPAASFVTLHHHEELRGCIGSLEADEALVSSVAHNAWAAAFRDARFSPLTVWEWPEIELHLSVLSPLEPLGVLPREALVASLCPKSDGLVLARGERRATFLPAVWDSVDEPDAFVAALERKLGMGPADWRLGVEAFRYSVEEWSG